MARRVFSTVVNTNKREAQLIKLKITLQKQNQKNPKYFIKYITNRQKDTNLSDTLSIPDKKA